MPKPNEFIAWALRPERTLEEAYCAERLVEEGYLHWRRLNGDEFRSGIQPSASAKQRRLNPAHRVKLNNTILARAAEALASMTCLSLDAHQDRPLRDIHALRFFPQLKILSLHGHEFRDISVLRALPALESVSMSSEELEDFTPISELNLLKVLHLNVRQPWPNVAGLEALAELEVFHWTGNLLPLEEVSRFGKVRIAKLNSGDAGAAPLRDATRLPEMPWLEELEIEGVHRLDGITRWPRLRNLTLGGNFKDLVPLTGLRGLTHLTLKGELTRDLTPLAQLPELRRLLIQSRFPQDYSVLAETPRLHEVAAEGCKINRMELATLHAVLAPWDEEFAAHEPRPCLPCRFLVRDPEGLPAGPRVGPGCRARWQEDAGMRSSELNWFKACLGNELGKLLEGADWGRVRAVSNGMACITLHKVDAAEQLPAIVDCARQLLRTTALPWHVHVSVDLRDKTQEASAPGGAGEDAEEQVVRGKIEDYRSHQHRRAEEEAYLEREHRMRLLAQAGTTIHPEEFAAPEESSLNAAAADFEVAAVPAAVDEQPVEGTFWMQGVISEEGFFADARGRAAAEHLMGRRAEDKAA